MPEGFRLPIKLAMAKGFDSILLTGYRAWKVNMHRKLHLSIRFLEPTHHFWLNSEIYALYM